MPSQRAQIQMDADERDHYLDEQYLGVLGTLGPDGGPHLVTVGYLREGSTLIVTSFAAAQKVKNVERDPRVSFLVETSRPYDQIRGVMVRGRAQVIDDTERIIDVARSIYVKAEAQGERQEIPQERIAPKRRLIVIEMERTSTWDHRKLDGRY